MKKSIALSAAYENIKVIEYIYLNIPTFAIYVQHRRIYRLDIEAKKKSLYNGELESHLTTGVIQGVRTNLVFLLRVFENNSGV